MPCPVLIAASRRPGRSRSRRPFVVCDKDGQALGYFYFEHEPGRRSDQAAQQGRGPAHCRQHLTRLGCYGCWPVLMTGSRPEASTRSIRFHLARAHWRALRGRHVLAAYGLGSGIENSKDSRSEDHSTLRKCHVWQLASARPYYLRSYPRPLPIPRKLSGEIAEGQRGAADHQRDFRDRWHFCRMDPVVEGRQCVEGPAPPLPWPWSGTRRQRRLGASMEALPCGSVRL
jgi:hypothetical protein